MVYKFYSVLDTIYDSIWYQQLIMTVYSSDSHLLALRKIVKRYKIKWLLQILSLKLPRPIRGTFSCRFVLLSVCHTLYPFCTRNSFINQYLTCLTCQRKLCSLVHSKLKSVNLTSFLVMMNFATERWLLSFCACIFACMHFIFDWAWLQEILKHNLI